MIFTALTMFMIIVATIINISCTRAACKTAFKKGIAIGRLQVLKENIVRADLDINKFEHGNNVVDALIANHDSNNK